MRGLRFLLIDSFQKKKKNLASKPTIYTKLKVLNVDILYHFNLHGIKYKTIKIKNVSQYTNSCLNIGYTAVIDVL